MTDLGGSGYGPGYSEATAINARGQIVGEGSGYAAFWNPLSVIGVPLIRRLQLSAESDIQVAFVALPESSSKTYHLETASAAGGPWSKVVDAVLTELEPDRYQFTLPFDAVRAAAFWRVIETVYVDTDGDGTPDGLDGCPLDPLKTEPGVCGCGIADTDTDGDSVPDCTDACPGHDDRLDADSDGLPDGCDPEPEVPMGMVVIPAGEFQMGDSFNGEGDSDELPVHTVYASEFYMDRSEVTKAFWDEVRAWAVANGYELAPGAGKRSGHPVQLVSWYDAVKWCNARSERAGLTPCYYTSADQTVVYRAGQVKVPNDWVKWKGGGYRLPTEVEWEKAAHGGLTSKRFPWGDTISHSQANYYSSPSYSYDVSSTRGCHPDYRHGADLGYPSPVGSFAPNGYGLYDMAGNVFEWCWDWLDEAWYARGEAESADCHGPASGSKRVLRGGGCKDTAQVVRCVARRGSEPTSGFTYRGFRCVWSAP